MEDNVQASGNKCLIAYYSRRGYNFLDGDLANLKIGNTEIVAQKIQALTSGDMFYVDTVKPYPVDYHQTTAVAKKEQNENVRPELTATVANMEHYDVIYLGYPNWWNTMPMAMFTFLESYNFAGKTIAPFCTHEGSGLGKSVQDIRELCPGATVTGGLDLRGINVKTSDAQIEKWVKGIIS